MAENKLGKMADGTDVIILRAYCDQMFCGWKGLKDLVLQEHERQILKWGIQKRSIFEWNTYLTEELGELAKAISEFTYRNGPAENIVKEGIQVATLALKIAEMFHSKDYDGIIPIVIEGNDAEEAKFQTEEYMKCPQQTLGSEKEEKTEEVTKGIIKNYLKEKREG